MSEEFPYPECEGCRALVDNKCHGVRYWLECKYLIREKFKGHLPPAEFPDRQHCETLKEYNKRIGKFKE